MYTCLVKSPCPCRGQRPVPTAVRLLQVQAAQAGVGWVRTKEWVSTAAARAPMTTEALLHSFITSSDSLPGSTSPAWLQEGGLATSRAGEGAFTPAWRLLLDDRVTQQYISNGMELPDAVVFLGGVRLVDLEPLI